MNVSVLKDIESIQRISAVPTILETVAATTGLGFVCVARVTKDSWTACAVLDRLDFGLQVGGELEVTTTLCEEVRDTGAAIIIDCVSNDEVYQNHHTPRIYGFQSYFSIPIFRSNGEYFGTLCGLDPKPANLSNPTAVSSMKLFSQLISLQLESEQQLVHAERRLQDEQKTAELREQFVAVLGHDLRTPLGSILAGVEIARRQSTDASLMPTLDRIGRSAQRISTLVDDVVDFTKGRMGGGISLNMRHEKYLHTFFEQVVGELQAIYPEREIRTQLQPDISLLCDAGRMSQLLSNLLKNALVHGHPGQPVFVSTSMTNGIFRLAVQNAGPRIAPEVVDQLFKPFWRGSKDAAHDGLGLGLYIVSQIAQSHNGFVDVITTDASTSFIYKIHGPEFVERRRSPRNDRLAG